MDKASLFQALTTQKHSKALEAVAELLWKTVSIKRQVEVEDANKMLKVVDQNFSNVKLGYLGYNILGPFFRYADVVQKIDKTLLNSAILIYIIV